MYKFRSLSLLLLLTSTGFHLLIIPERHLAAAANQQQQQQQALPTSCPERLTSGCICFTLAPDPPNITATDDVTVTSLPVVYRCVDDVDQIPVDELAAVTDISVLISEQWNQRKLLGTGAICRLQNAPRLRIVVATGGVTNDASNLTSLTACVGDANIESLSVVGDSGVRAAGGVGGSGGLGNGKKLDSSVLIDWLRPVSERLRNLDLSGINMTTFVELADFVTTSTSLISLDLSGNRLTALGANVTSSASPCDVADQRVDSGSLFDAVSTLSAPVFLTTTATSGQHADDNSTEKFQVTLRQEDLIRDSGSGVGTRVSGESCVGFNRSSLRVLNVSWNHIEHLEAGLFDGRFADLAVLDLSFNRLSRLDNMTFVDLVALTTFNLSHNALDDIDADAFAMTPERRELKTVPVGLRRTVSERRELETGGDVGQFDSSGSKQKEEQYYISLASCTRGWLDIQVVDLSYNRLTWLREGLLEQALCAVRRLLLSHNRIDRLPRYVFEHLPYLTQLDLSDNALVWLDVGAFTNPSLTDINLAGNQLRKVVSMTFLYLPAVRRIDLSRNEITYVYKFAFYRMCSDERRPIAVSLHANRLNADAVWKMLTTFEHLEGTGCRVDVDLSDNDVERFLTPEALEYVQRRLQAAADDDGGDSQQLQHFRRWGHVTINLNRNRMRCDCSLADELRAVDDVFAAVQNGSAPATGSDVIAKAWRRLNCTEPERLRGIPVAEFVDHVAVDRCARRQLVASPPCLAGCVCVALTSPISNSTEYTMNCSGRQMTDFQPKLDKKQSADKEEFNRKLRTLDLSHNRLSILRPEALFKRFPSLSVLLLNDNRLTSIPTQQLVESGRRLKQVSLIGNPVSCDCAAWEEFTGHAELERIVVDWSQITCSDGRHLPDAVASCPKKNDISAESFKGFMLTTGMVGVSVVLLLLTVILMGVALSIRLSGRKRRRHSRVRDVIASDELVGDFRSGCVDDVLVTYCSADDAWVRSILLPIIRKQSTSVSGGVRLLPFVNGAEVESREFVADLRTNLAENRSTIVVVSRQFADAVLPVQSAAYRKTLADHQRRTGRCLFVLKSSSSEAAARDRNIGGDDESPLSRCVSGLSGHVTLSTAVDGPQFADRLRYQLACLKLSPPSSSGSNVGVDAAMPGRRQLLSWKNATKDQVDVREKLMVETEKY